MVQLVSISVGLERTRRGSRSSGPLSAEVIARLNRHSPRASSCEVDAGSSSRPCRVSAAQDAAFPGHRFCQPTSAVVFVSRRRPGSGSAGFVVRRGCRALTPTGHTSLTEAVACVRWVSSRGCHRLKVPPSGVVAHRGRRPQMPSPAEASAGKVAGFAGRRRPRPVPGTVLQG